MRPTSGQVFSDTRVWELAKVLLSRGQAGRMGRRNLVRQPRSSAEAPGRKSSVAGRGAALLKSNSAEKQLCQKAAGCKLS